MLKKKRPYQGGGGITPIQAPLYNSADWAPLISVASMPIKTGVEIGVQARAQRLARERMRLARDQFGWQQEKWQEEMDYKKEAHEMDMGLKTIELILKASQMNSGTGFGKARRGNSTSSGLPSNFHTDRQQMAAQDVEKKVQGVMKDYSDKYTVSDYAKDPSKFFELTGAFQDARHNPELREARVQAAYYQNQMDTLAKDKDGVYDRNLAAYYGEKYAESDLDYRAPLLYENLTNVGKEIQEVIKDKWGMPQRVPFGEGFHALVQQNPNIRDDFEGLLKSRGAATLRGRYNMEQDLAETYGLDAIAGEDYESWADRRVKSAAASMFPDSYKTTTGLVQEKDGGGDDGSGSVNGIETGAYNRLPAHEVPIKEFQGETNPKYFSESIGDYDPKAEGFNHSQRIMDNYVGHTFGDEATQTARPENQGKRIYLSDEKEIAGFQDKVRTLYPNAEDLTLFGSTKEVNGKTVFEVTPQGMAANDNWNKLMKENYNHQPVVYSLSNKKQRLALEENLRNQLEQSTAKLIHRETGDVWSQEQISTLIADSNKDDLNQVPLRLSGVMDLKQSIPIMGVKGNQAGDLSVFQVDPMTGTIAGEKFFIGRDQSYIDANPNRSAGGAYFHEATLGVGMERKLSEDFKKAVGPGTFYTAQGDYRTNEDLQQELLGKVKGVTRPKDNAQGNPEGLVLSYKGDTNTGSLSVSDPANIGVGLTVLDNLSGKLGEGQFIEVNEMSDGSWGVKVDREELTPIGANDRMMDHNEEIEEHAKQNAYVDISKFPGVAGNYEYDTVDTPVEKLNKGFAQDLATYLFPSMDFVPKLNSALRHGDDGKHGHGLAVDLEDSPEMMAWAKQNVPGFEDNLEASRQSGSFILQDIWMQDDYQSFTTPLAVAYHPNMNTGTGEETGGYHWHFTYSKAHEKK